MWHFDILGAANSGWLFFFPSEEESWVIGNNLQMLSDLSCFWKANDEKKKKKKKKKEIRMGCGKWHTHCVFQVTDVGTIVGRNQEALSPPAYLL